MTRMWFKEAQKESGISLLNLPVKNKDEEQERCGLYTQENAAEVREGTQRLFISVSGEPT